jgi:hypothetical protein
MESLGANGTAKKAAEEINSKLRTGAGVKTEVGPEENLCAQI